MKVKYLRHIIIYIFNLELWKWVLTSHSKRMKNFFSNWNLLYSVLISAYHHKQTQISSVLFSTYHYKQTQINQFSPNFNKTLTWVGKIFESVVAHYPSIDGHNKPTFFKGELLFFVHTPFMALWDDKISK